MNVKDKEACFECYGRGWVAVFAMNGWTRKGRGYSRCDRCCGTGVEKK